MHSSLVTMSDSPQSAPPSAIRYRRSQDIEEHAQLSGWQLRYDQLSAGRFSGEILEVQLDGMQLIRDRANQAMLKQAATWPGAIVFAMPMRCADPHVHCGGHSIHAPSLLIGRGAQLPELRVHGDLDAVCIAIDEQSLQRTLHQQQRELDLTRLSRCYQLLDQADQQQLISLFGSVLDQQAPGATLLDHGTIRGAIRDAVVMHLLELIDSEDDHSLSPSARRRMVDRARDYALAHPERPVNILELCNQIGASRRKLQYCFQEALGINPIAYLRTIRLNAVHRQLRHASEADSVQSIAANWGFWHLSRFASDYRQLFGCKPSETLRQARQYCAENG
nr:helix-turn-helix domain-containing protein [uncultured Pseudomonas sp.]